MLKHLKISMLLQKFTVYYVYIYSGPVLALALARTGAVHHWKNILGPSEINKAKEESPDWWVMRGPIHSHTEISPEK